MQLGLSELRKSKRLSPDGFTFPAGLCNNTYTYTFHHSQPAFCVGCNQNITSSSLTQNNREHTNPLFSICVGCSNLGFICDMQNPIIHVAM